jgi:membrane protease subunit HflK
MRRPNRWWLPALALIALVSYTMTGLCTVAPGEVVVLRRLGRLQPQPLGPGLHWTAPWGIDRRDRVRLDAVRRLEIGSVAVAGPNDDPAAGEFLTGDRNLLHARATLEYRVADPLAYVTRTAAPEALLARLADAALARALASRSIDGVLGADRPAVAREAAETLAQAVDREALGLAILGVRLTDVRPPREVQPDFDAAQAARAERDQKASEASAVAARTIAAATAEAEARLQAASAEAERLLQLARAEAARFEALVDTARADRERTILRLHTDAVRALLPRARRTVILAPHEPLDLTLMPDTGASTATKAPSSLAP